MSKGNDGQTDRARRQVNREAQTEVVHDFEHRRRERQERLKQGDNKDYQGTRHDRGRPR